MLGLQNRCTWNGVNVPRLGVRLFSAAALRFFFQALRKLLHYIVLVHSCATLLRTQEHTSLVCLYPLQFRALFPRANKNMSTSFRLLRRDEARDLDDCDALSPGGGSWVSLQAP